MLAPGSGLRPSLRRFRSNLRCFRQKPFAGDAAAEIVQKRAASGIDRIGEGLRRAMFPEFDVGMPIGGMNRLSHSDSASNRLAMRREMNDIIGIHNLLGIEMKDRPVWAGCSWIS